MCNNQMNQSHSLSYNETVFLIYQKAPKVNLKPLLLEVRMKKSTKSGKRLQNKGWS